MKLTLDLSDVEAGIFAKFLDFAGVMLPKVPKSLLPADFKPHADKIPGLVASLKTQVASQLSKS